MDVLPVQGAANPGSLLQFASSVNGGAYVNQLTINTLAGNQLASFTPNVTSPAFIGSSYISAGSNGATSYKTTNGGSFVASSLIFVQNSTVTAGTKSHYIDPLTNGYVLAAANSSGVRIARAAIDITNLDNTAGSEDADLIFLTQAAGAAMAERLRISNVGALKASAYGSGTITGTPTYTLAVDATGNIIETTAGAGITRSINNISINTTAGASSSTDYVYLISGTTTLTLPTAVGNTNRYTLKNIGINTVTINTTSSQTIDGSTSITMAVQYTAVDVISDGTNWNII